MAEMGQTRVASACSRRSRHVRGYAMFSVSLSAVTVLRTSRMIINQARFRLFAVFWIAIIASQSYFLYKKFHALSVCHDQHSQLDAMQAQMDNTRR
jgi:hypothetical protein